MAIEDKDLLQVNATIIAGTLVFLTVIGLANRSRIEELGAVLESTFPFALSATFTLFAGHIPRVFTAAKICTAIGFPILIGAMSWFIMPFFKS